ncbi:MAG: rod shape-determining protein RodA, partial [Pseudomonadota bacterium]
MATRYDYADDRELTLGRKLLRFNWLLAGLLAAVAAVGFAMLYSIAGGSLDPWARTQIVRFALGFGVMMLVALIDLRFWRAFSAPFYALSLLLLVLVEVAGARGMGAERWILIGPIRVQPSELMKVALVLVLARYYQWLDPARVSRPLWVAIPILLALAPAALVIKQPDLGTALLLLAGAAVLMMLAGVSWWYFGVGALAVAAAVFMVLESKGTDWQLLKDYQYSRIDTFLNPSPDDRRGDGYNIDQAKIAIGSGGFDGKGFEEGTQKRLGFVPELHTDFIFTTLAEEFGFRGGILLLSAYLGIVLLSMLAAARIRSAFGRLVAAGVATTFFLYFAINMGMVSGLLPVVGVPLPLVS